MADLILVLLLLFLEIIFLFHFYCGRQEQYFYFFHKMIGQARIYYIYQSLIFIIIRIFIPVFLFAYILLLVLNNSFDSSIIKFPLVLLSLFLIVETFSRFKISRKLPEVEVQLSKGNVLDSFTLKSLSIFISQKILRQ